MDDPYGDLPRHGVDDPARRVPVDHGLPGFMPLTMAARTRLVEHMQLHLNVRTR
jgi:hypothetical protein